MHLPFAGAVPDDEPATPLPLLLPELPEVPEPAPEAEPEPVSDGDDEVAAEGWAAAADPEAAPLVLLLEDAFA